MKRLYERPEVEITDSRWSEGILVSGSDEVENYKEGASIQVGDEDEEAMDLVWPGSFRVDREQPSDLHKLDLNLSL